jgi:hypothetical protein
LGNSGWLFSASLLVSGAEGMEQVLRVHDVVTAFHLGNRENIDHADQSFPQRDRLRETLVLQRRKLKHEHPDVRLGATVAVVSPYSEPQLQKAPQHDLQRVALPHTRGQTDLFEYEKNPRYARATRKLSA